MYPILDTRVECKGAYCNRGQAKVQRLEYNQIGLVFL